MGEFEWQALEAAKYINDIFINIILREIVATIDNVYCSSSHLYANMKKNSFDCRTKSISPDFNRPWIFPTCENENWALVIINYCLDLIVYFKIFPIYVGL